MGCGWGMGHGAATACVAWRRYRAGVLMRSALPKALAAREGDSAGGPRRGKQAPWHPWAAPAAIKAARRGVHGAAAAHRSLLVLLLCALRVAAPPLLAQATQLCYRYQHESWTSRPRRARPEGRRARAPAVPGSHSAPPTRPVPRASAVCTPAPAHGWLAGCGLWHKPSSAS